MLNQIKNRFHWDRSFKNYLCQILVVIKNFIWKTYQNIKWLPIKIRTKMLEYRCLVKTKKNKLNNNEWGTYLWGYLNFSSLLDKKIKKLKIADNIRKIKIDVGLAYNAPNSAIWLDKLPDRIVFGFEANPENVQELLSGTNRLRNKTCRYVNPKYINERFFIFNLAIDSDEPSFKTFYMTQKDPGTSSLYRPNFFKVKKVIKIPSIRLSDFLDLLPWDKIEYIEHLKVDTQGNDLRVIKSAAQYLKERIVFVSAEYTTKNQYKYSHTEKELDIFMQQNGFTIVEGTQKNLNKTYLNQKFKNLADKLDCSTEGL